MAPSTQSGSHRVFNIYELVEDILYRLPLEDILVATAVCAYWRDVVLRSSDILKNITPADSVNRTLPATKDIHYNVDPMATWSFSTRSTSGTLHVVRRRNLEILAWVTATPNGYLLRLWFDCAKGVVFDSRDKHGTWRVELPGLDGSAVMILRIGIWNSHLHFTSCHSIHVARASRGAGVVEVKTCVGSLHSRHCSFGGTAVLSDGSDAFMVDCVEELVPERFRLLRLVLACCLFS